MSLNRYFEFSRRQLWFLAAFSGIALAMAGWLVVRTFIVPRADAEPLVINTGAPTETDRPIAPDRIGRFTVDPNTAPIDSLELLPGIGPVKAARIVACRDNEPFKTIEDLTRVKGIGPGTLDMIRPFLKVTPP